MNTLTYGSQQPVTGDASSVWMPGLAANVAQFDAHIHDGITSASLPGSSIVRPTSTIAQAQWVADSGGNYHFTVTVPVAISGAPVYNDINNYAVTCRISTAGATFGHIIYPSIERVTSTTFTVRVNSNAIDVLITYT